MATATSTAKIAKVTPIGEPRQEKILSTRVVEVPGKDGNRVKKTVINDKFWALGEVPENHSFITVQDFFLNDDKGNPTQSRVTNVLSTSEKEAALSITEKIAIVAGADPAVAMAIATLLK